MTEPDPDLSVALTTLRELMGAERRAIARLDVVALDALTAQKAELVQRLAAHRTSRRPVDPTIARLLAAARAELAANAALLAAAKEAVQAALGVERSTGYGRSARAYLTTRPMRVIAV